MTFQNHFPRFSYRLWLTVGLFVALAIAFGLYVRSEKQVDRANDLRYQSFLLADELRQSSDDLTRMARTYVVTGHPAYQQHYQAILDIREGRQPRPQEYQNVYWDLVLADGQPPRPASPQAIPLLELMRQAGFTEQEFQKLVDAKAISDALTATEREAMQLAQSTGLEAEADRAKARLMLYDDRYHQAKAAIMQPIAELYRLVDQRTHEAVHSAETRATLFRFILIAFGLGLLYRFWRDYKVLRDTLGGSVDTVYAQITQMVDGNLSPTMPIKAGLENTVLGWLAETRARLEALNRERQQAEAALRESEARVRTKLHTLLTPDGDLDVLELADVLDVPAIQTLLDQLFDLTPLAVGILDLEGRVLVATGWQDICVNFHRAHPQTCRNCVESDTALSLGVEPGTFKIYRCKNQMYDMATPIIIGGRHLGNVFLGQFFFDDEPPNRERFRMQARQYGFDEEAYLAALDRVPRWSRKKVNSAMTFYTRLTHLISAVNYSNLQLARGVAERDHLLTALQNSNARYDDLVRRIPVGIYTLRMHADGMINFEYVSEKFCQMLGLNEHDVLCDAELVHERIHPDDRAFLDAANRLVAQTLEPFCWEGRSQLCGRMRWIHIESDPTALPNGDSLWNGVIMDITERKQAEHLLFESKNELQKIYDSVPIMICQLNLDRKVIEANAYFRSFTGWPDHPIALSEKACGVLGCIHSLEDAKGCGFGSHCKDCDLRLAIKNTIETGRNHVGIEYQTTLLINGFKTGVLMLCSTALIQKNDQNVVLLSMIDITERKRAEDALHRSLADIKRHNVQMSTLNRMNDLLLSCETCTQAYEVIATIVGTLFAGCNGGLAMYEAAAPDLRVVATWGDAHTLPPTFPAHDCWALQRSELYEVADPAHSVYCQHFTAPLPEHPSLCVPLTVRGETLGLLQISATAVLAKEAFQEWRNLVIKVGGSIKLALSNLKLQEALREQAIHDALTGMFNRRYLDETLPRELYRCQRSGEPLAVAMLDLDHFKGFNDAYGHEAGDAILRTVGELLQRSSRIGDLACRYGGEELTLILHGATADQAKARLDSLRQDISHLHVFYKGSELPTITVSIGVAVAGKLEMNTTALLGRADMALYQAKKSGRNCVVIADE